MSDLVLLACPGGAPASWAGAGFLPLRRERPVEREDVVATGSRPGDVGHRPRRRPGGGMTGPGASAATLVPTGNSPACEPRRRRRAPGP